jgi:hypothetical protein
MYYKATHVTDSKSQVILAARVSGADVVDPDAAMPALVEAKDVLESNGRELKKVVADAGYDDSTFHANVEGLGAVPITNYIQKTGGKPEGFTKDSFQYDPEKDVYVCPNGAVLKPDSRTHAYTLYHPRSKDCADCPLRASCIEPDVERRTISRPKNEDARVRNISRCHTDEGRKALRKRKTVVEPPFAHMKRFGGMKLMSCRGAERVQARVTIGAIAWNIMKLVKDLDQDAEDSTLAAIFGVFRAISGLYRTARALLSHKPATAIPILRLTVISQGF